MFVEQRREMASCEVVCTFSCMSPPSESQEICPETDMRKMDCASTMYTAHLPMTHSTVSYTSSRSCSLAMLLLSVVKMVVSEVALMSSTHSTSYFSLSDTANRYSICLSLMHIRYFSSLEILTVRGDERYYVREQTVALSTPRRRIWYFSPLFTLYRRMSVPRSETVASNEPSSESEMARTMLSCASRCSTPEDSLYG